ncbi:MULTISPECIES: hypothetical protein [unclassified Streptomyces]|uniref:hypothetical protein n=1 Tax=unclassified Streptomyces TaxID=2593676 RepID=UPI00035F59E1|nr:MULTISPECIES: hypothetical protein [unclassified Streptomyces]MYT28281.1 hypothetical protein [Streptomyces sp. SID8354]
MYLTVYLPLLAPALLAATGPRLTLHRALTSLRALPADERAVLLAHERAHLTHRHHRHTALARAACALNPLLRSLRGRLSFTLESWADEEAAMAVASRPLAARPQARAAVATAAKHGGPTTALAYLRHKVTARIQALQGVPPQSRYRIAVPAAALATVTALADVTAALGRFLEVLRP